MAVRRRMIASDNKAHAPVTFGDAQRALSITFAQRANLQPIDDQASCGQKASVTAAAGANHHAAASGRAFARDGFWLEGCLFPGTCAKKVPRPPGQLIAAEPGDRVPEPSRVPPGRHLVTGKAPVSRVAGAFRRDAGRDGGFRPSLGKPPSLAPSSTPCSRPCPRRAPGALIHSFAVAIPQRAHQRCL